MIFAMNGRIRQTRTIRRLHLFEFGDQCWLPTVCRNYLAEILQYQITNYNLYTATLAKLKELLQLADCNRLVDLCSGCGGAVFHLQELLERENLPVSVLLTDKFPDTKTIKRLRQNPTSSITYFESPVDATKVPHHLSGLRTLFTCFHHFKPTEARLILMNAVADKAPIAIFEFTERKMANIIGMLLAPIAVLFQSKQLTPLKWSRIFLTYLFPVIPLLYWWDGTVSHLRTYTVEELRVLVSGIDSESYYWEAGKINSGRAGDPGKGACTTATLAQRAETPERGTSLGRSSSSASRLARTREMPVGASVLRPRDRSRTLS